jgi:hypothetical protein
MAFVGFGGFNRANQAAILQQQVADQQKARAIFQQIGYVPQGGPTNQHGDVNKAVSLGGVKTFGSTGPSWAKGLGVDLNGDGKISKGVDGRLVLDLDGNGIYDNNDVKDTLAMLELFSGKTQESGSGNTGFGGFNQADQAKKLLLQSRGKQADLNQDGILSGWELNKMGAKVLVSDKSRPFPTQNFDGTATAGGFRTETVPGAYRPDYQPRPTYYPQPPIFGGYQPPSFAPPPYFRQMLSQLMSFFPRPY